MPRQLLVVEKDSELRGQFRARMSLAGYEVTLASTLEAARTQLESRLPDVLILGNSMIAGADDFIRLVSARGALQRVPVVLLDSAETPTIPDRDFDAVIRMPATEELILARLRSVLRMSHLEEELAMRASTCRDFGLAEPVSGFSGPAHVVLVPRCADDGVALADALSFEVSGRISILSRRKLLARLEQGLKPDVVLIEADPGDPVPDRQCLSDLRCRPETRHAALMMSYPEGAEAEAAMALDLGASDVLVGETGPAMIAALMRRHIAHAERLGTLRAQVQDGLRLAVIDPLTGLYNRRYAINHVARLTDRAAETGRPLAVMLLDIDRFKLVNDTHGHQNGDLVIGAVARTLLASVREGDLVARFGGEEFLVAIPDTTLAEAEHAASRLCRRVAGLGVTLDDGARVSVTLSIGLKVGLPERGCPEDVVTRLIAEADRALYDAKAEGRNHVTTAQSAA